MRRILMLLFVLVLGVSLVSPVRAEEERGADSRVPPKALKSITAVELQEAVDFLADDKLRGREAGTEDSLKTSAYVAAHYKSLGLEAIGDDGTYFQNFKIAGKKARNTIALLEGSDPVLKKQYLIIGAHHDHVGMGNNMQALDSMFGAGRGKVHNGADDNASGTSTVMELAEAFAMLPTAPKRSIIFMTFDGEEAGLLGSAYYVKNPVVPLKDTVFMFNADMVGRAVNGVVEVHGTGTAAGLRELVEDCARGVPLKLEYVDYMVQNSDHWSFYKRGVPVTFFFTKEHPDYHRATDDPEKINSWDMQRIARLTMRLVYRIANAPERPAFKKVTGGGGPAMNLRDMLKMFFPGKKSAKAKVKRPKFGIMPRETDSGVYSGGIVPRTPAQYADLREDDRIESVDGMNIASIKDLRTAVKKAGRRSVEVVVERDGETRTVTVDFSGKPAAKPKAAKPTKPRRTQSEEF